MSDQTTTPTTPAAPVPVATTSDAGTVTTAGQEAQAPAQPFRTFQSQAELDAFVTKSKSQAGRKALNDQARALGYDDWQEMSEALQPLRRGGDVASQATPSTPTMPDAAATPAAAAPAQPDEASRLRMALQVGTKLNLPTALVSRLQGTTAEEMEADANALLGLMTAPQRGPGIPPVIQQNQPVTFTRTQLQDPKFVREHIEEIKQATREGRIRDS